MSASGETHIDVRLSLPLHQALALAELCKRITWSHCRDLSVDEDETRAMIGATDHVRAQLAEAGIVVR